MEEEPVLKDQVRWYGTYKGLNFEIAKWKNTFTEETKQYDRGYTWNYYIYVKPRKIKTYKGYRDERRVDYYKMYSDVEMHGGITYWSRTKSSCGLREVDTIGCDYAHLWDTEFGEPFGKHKENSHEWIMRDVKDTIDKLPKDLFFTS